MSLDRAAVVIPARDPGGALARLLVSLAAANDSGRLAEIVVVDDGSVEDLSAVCAAHGARHLRRDRSAGPAAARNAGAAATSAPILLFFDADVLCPAGLPEAVFATFAARPEALAVSFRSRGFDPECSVVANFGAALEQFWLGLYLAAGGGPAFVEGVTSRSFAVRRDAFDALRGFDEAFRTNAIEDLDFGLRLAAGGPLLLAAEPQVDHRYPAGLSRLLRNYAVRAFVFGRWYAARRPKLPRVHVSPGEGLLRILGTAALVALAAGALGSAPLAVGGAILAAVYFAAIGPFLRHAARLGSWRFALLAALLHLGSSPVIVSAAFSGLASGVLAPRRGDTVPRLAGAPR
ncbi:MAG: glycosyltransferase [Thermoanaerobaculia bacterium]